MSDRGQPTDGTPGWGRGDDETEMDATRFLADDVIEAIVHGGPVEPVHAPLAAFARSVRALGDGPVPRASDELAVLLEQGLDASTSARRDAPRAVPAKLTVLATRVAGLGIVAKVALGSSLAAAGVGAAGAAGVLPAAANDTVRNAIESVTPVEFDDRSGEPGSTTTPSIRPADDGAGSDEPTVADDTTGAEDRPGPGAVDEPPGQSGETGLTRANETPAAPHAPESTPANTTPAATAPSTVPAQGPPDEPGHGRATGSVPSTVPAARGGLADGHVPGA